MHNKAYMYAKECIKSKKAPKYVKKQAKQFIYIADGKSEKYFINEERLKQIESILKLLIMPKGYYPWLNELGVCYLLSY